MEEIEKVDIDMCLIFIDRLSNPHLDPVSRERIFKELKDASKHDELHNLVESAKANIFGIRDTFRNKARELNGETAEEIIDSSTYINALKILIDPNIKDGEFKPNFKILMEGKLTDDQQQQARIIMNCTDPRQRETMMDDFKKSFKPKPKKKVEKVVPEKPAGSGEGSVPVAELEGDLRSLISKLIDPKVKKENKTDIYLKLMESKDADYKNVAIQLIDPSNKKRLDEIVKEFDQMLEGKKQRELREAKAKKEAEELQKKIAREKREKLEKKKQEMMKKRKLTLQMRAEQRRKETESGQLMTQEEKDTYRRLEREKVMEMIKRNREADRNASKKNVNEPKTSTQEDKSRISFVILPWTRDLSELPEVTLEIQDMSISQDLADREKQELEKLLNPFRVNKPKNEEEIKPAKEEKEDVKSNNITEERKPVVEKKEESTFDKPSKPSINETDPKVEAEPDHELPEFKEYFAKLNKCDLDDTEETDIIKELIKGRKTDLLKELIVRLSKIKGVGKSKMFGILCTKFVGERVYSATPKTNEDTTANEKQDKEVDDKSEEGKSKATNIESKDYEKENKQVLEAKNSVFTELKNTAKLPKPVLIESSVKVDEKEASQPSVPKVDKEDDKSKSEESAENNHIKDDDVQIPTTSNKDAEIPTKAESSSMIKNKDTAITSNDAVDHTSSNIVTEDDSGGQTLNYDNDKKSTKNVPEEIKTSSKISARSSKSIDDKNKEKSKKMNSNVAYDKDVTKVPESLQEPASVKKGKRASSKKVDQVEKNVLKMSMAEVRDYFSLKRIHSYVKIKRNKNLHVAYLAQQRRLSENDSTSEQSPVRKRKADSAQPKVTPTKRQKVVVNPLFALNENLIEDKIPKISNGSNDNMVKENGVSDSDSNIASTSSITASSTNVVRKNAYDDSQCSSKKAEVDIKDASNDKVKVNGDITKRKRSVSRSRSRSRSKSISRSRSKSLSRSRSRSISRSRSKSKSRSRSMSLSRSRSKSISRSRSKSISRSRSKSISRSRSKSISKSRSKSMSRSRSKSLSRSRSRSNS